MTSAGSDTRLRLAQDAAGLGVWEWDLRSGAVSWDERCATLLGVDGDAPHTLAGLVARVHPDDLAEVRAAFGPAAQRAEPVEATFRVRRADGVRTLFTRGQALGDGVEGLVPPAGADSAPPARVVGAVLDVTAYAAAAQAEAEYARRLSRMAAVSLLLAGAHTVEELVEIVVGQGLEVLGADGGSLCVRDDERGVVHLAATASLPERVHVEFAELPLDGPLPGSYVARTGETVLLPTRASGLAFSPAMQVVYDGTGRDAWAVLPLQVDSQLLGSLVVSWAQERAFPDEDLELLRGFAAQCSQSLHRVQARAAEQQAALDAQRLSETLQRSLLTSPPQPEHLQIAVRYQPAGQQAQVGGDWYDAFRTDSGSTMLVIGDVNGHDRDAAAMMGQVRNLLRGLAVDSEQSPAALLSRLDAALRRLELDTLATAVLARVERPLSSGRDDATLRWSNAGHLPPLLLRPDGSAELLGQEPDLLLGVGQEEGRLDSTVALPDRSTLVLFTDGLVERRDEDLDVGLERLRRTAVELADLDVEALADAVLARLLPDGGDDDVALLVLRVQPAAVPAQGGPPPREQLQRLALVPDALAARWARRHVSAVCSQAQVPDDLCDSAVLLTSELVTNAVLHGRSEVRLAVRADVSCVRVEVADDNSRLPERAAQDPEALDGRGLAILEVLASDWGAVPDGVGKTVWFELRAG